MQCPSIDVVVSSITSWWIDLLWISLHGSNSWPPSSSSPPRLMVIYTRLLRTARAGWDEDRADESGESRKDWSRNALAGWLAHKMQASFLSRSTRVSIGGQWLKVTHSPQFTGGAGKEEEDVLFFQSAKDQASCLIWSTVEGSPEEKLDSEDIQR